MRDHPPLVISEFRGTFDRGELDTVPMSFFTRSLNIEFTDGGIDRRAGVERLLPVLETRRIAIYKRYGEAQRLLVLDNRGYITDSVTGLQILYIPAMSDFSMVTIFDRAYISPHNGVTGLPGEKIYVYEGSGQARPAGGVGPGATPKVILAVSATAGVVEAGAHAVAVAFETVTGYISPYGAFEGVVADGTHAIDVLNIPLGPAGTVARVIVATHIVQTWNGDFLAQTFYRAGRIPDNTTTTYLLDGYDSQLVDDVSYLVDQLGTIPAGVGIGLYRSRMLVWGEDLNPSVCRASKAGFPESHDAVEGYVTVNPGDAGGGLKYCFEFRNQLICCKSQRTYGTQDNGDSAALWEVGLIDNGIGAECHGVGRALDFGESVEDRVFVADRSGLRLFVGTYPDVAVISFNIDGLWGRITKEAFNTIEVALDPINNRVYVAVPLDGVLSPNFIFYGDYTDGVAETEIKWSAWQFPWNPTSIVVDVVDAEPVLRIGSIHNNVYTMNPELDTDENFEGAPATIQQLIEFPFIPVGPLDETVNHYTGIRMRLRGEGVLDITLRGLDDGIYTQAMSINLRDKPGQSVFRGFNFTNEHCAVALIENSINGWFRLTKFIIYLTPVWDERPVVD